MIWRSLICFSAALACCSAGTALEGSVELRDSRENSVIREHDYSGVVVWLEPTGTQAGPQPPVSGHATMLQKGKRFIPHILAVRKGTVVDFPNQDPIFHNAFSSFSGQIFDVGLYKPGSTRSITFNRPGVVRVFCNIHSTMSAVIVVVDSPWFATTQRNGSFQIAGVPPGEYRLHAFHERATPSELAKAERTVIAGPGDPVKVTISETGFLPAPHLDKYGKPYKTDTGDNYKVVP